jgi:hypothetical protein
LVDGRKYGRGGYGAKSYDLGVVHVLPPWIPIPGVSVEAWIPIPTQPAWVDSANPNLYAAEIWTPIPASPTWSDSTNPNLYATEKWKPVLMPVN